MGPVVLRVRNDLLTNEGTMNPGLFPLITCLMLFPSPLAGQSAPARASATRVPVTVALVDRLPYAGAPFVVLRRSDATPRDVILLPSSADADLLPEAVWSLVVARQDGGDTSATPSRSLPGVGAVPAVEIWLPPQRRRATAP